MLEVEQLTLDYGEQRFCFDLRVAAGACTALIGPSGAGKSTLLTLIAGFVRPLSGALRFDGVDLTALTPAARPVTTVFQEHNLFAHLDAGRNVGLGIDPGLKLDRDDRRRVSAAFEQVGLGGLERRLPAQLSGGQRQRVVLARALVRRRPLLLLDEPFAALGPALRAEMLALVDALRRDIGLTVLLVSHHPDDARLIASQTAFVCDGAVRLLAPTADLLRRGHPLPALRDYLGDSAP